MDDAQLLRYSRHILLDELGPDAQARFAAAHALVIGVGGLGAPVAQFLAGAGVGTLTLCDADRVDLTNLQRQILYATADIGHPKVAAAAARLAAINPHVRVQPLEQRVGYGALGRRVAQIARAFGMDVAVTSRSPVPDADVVQLPLDELLATADVVSDCCDNFDTRHAVNRACVDARKPLVSGAALRFDGQLAVFDTRDPASPCYHCLFGEGDELEETRCATMGVFAPLVGIVGATQAAEALKLLAGAGESLAGRLLLLDALSMQWREVRVPRDPLCPVCSGRPDGLPAPRS